MAILNHEVINVTPDLAKRWLGEDVISSHQRDWNVLTSKKYARDMLDGFWSDDCADPIVFAKNGKLINGQHRLHSIVQSGKEFPFLVVTVESESAYDFMDIGKPRKFKDLIGKDVPNKSMLQAFTSKILKLECGESARSIMESGHLRSLPEMLKFARDHMTYLQSLIKLTARNMALIGKGSYASIALVLHICENVFGSGTAEYIENTLRVQGIDFVTLRDKIHSAYMGVSPRPCVSGYIFAQYCKHIIEGETVGTLTVKDGLSAYLEIAKMYTPGSKMLEQPIPSNFKK